MKCRYCSAATRVLETREQGGGYVTARRRACGNEHTFWTYEVDDSIEKTVVKHALRPERIGGLVSRGLLFQRDQRIARRLREGHKHMNVAAEFGLADNTVSRIARCMGVPSVRARQLERTGT